MSGITDGVWDDEKAKVAVLDTRRDPYPHDKTPLDSIKEKSSNREKPSSYNRRPELSSPRPLQKERHHSPYCLNRRNREQSPDRTHRKP